MGEYRRRIGAAISQLVTEIGGPGRVGSLAWAAFRNRLMRRAGIDLAAAEAAMQAFNFSSAP